MLQGCCVLCEEYTVIYLDFQGIGSSGFETEEKFVQEFGHLKTEENAE